MGSLKPTAAACFAMAAFVILATQGWGRHTEIGDAQVYQVVARNIVEDGRWLDLRYLPTVHPRFYEHLPFGFWVMAAAIHLLGEASLRPLFLLFSVVVVLLAGLLARRFAGGWAGVVALVALGTTEKFFHYAGYPLLDPLLAALSTASAAAVLLGRPGARRWLLAGLLAAGATAVKGPFGLVALCAAAVARAVVDRSWRTLVAGIFTALVAALPVAIFLAVRADWLEGYFVRQVVDSTTGARSDGRLDRLYAFKTVAGRFWPWLPLLVPSVVVALDRPRAWAQRLAATSETRRACQLLWLAVLAALLALSVPVRKIWHHTLLVYPFLAALCGIGVGPWLERLLAPPSRARQAVVAAGALAAAAAIAVAAGIDRLVMYPPCAMYAAFDAELSRIPPGTNVLVVSPRAEFDIMSCMAAERRLVPWQTSLDAPTRIDPTFPRAPVAVVDERLWREVSGFSEVARGRGWFLARRSD